MKQTRRQFLFSLATFSGAGLGHATYPSLIQRALAIKAKYRTGTIQDVEHIVILTQENRSFDHYFGTLNGVRGFADPFPIPVADKDSIESKNIWHQPNHTPDSPIKVVGSFHLNTTQQFEAMRVEGTPHTWSNAQQAWNQGKMDAWPKAKFNHSMGYYTEQDIPFQFALAKAFTVCDAYHCSFQGGTTTNRLFLMTGTNDPQALNNGPSTYNDYENFDSDPGKHGGYNWTTYPERLEAAGISWQIYQNMEDNFNDNALTSFKSFRDAWFQNTGYSEILRQRGVSTRDLDKLKEDVLNNKLPQVSWIIATAEGSEHPTPSSPAQGADYTAKVLEALTANPEVWSKTVFIINFDENDGFFDHSPPPAAPSCLEWHTDKNKAKFAGASTVDTTGEYHEHLLDYHNKKTEAELLHRNYGLGPRVPMYIISPWSKGGWVNSQVFDHTSVIRFIEARFGVYEPNISPWRRAVCGDLTSAFNFNKPDNDTSSLNLPDTQKQANLAQGLSSTTIPAIPSTISLPVQTKGVRPARALPYELDVRCNSIKLDQQNSKAPVIELLFLNTGSAATVFHVYDQLNLNAIPRRYTVEANKKLTGHWLAETGHYDLWVLGPNGFHRHFTGNVKPTLEATNAKPDIQIMYHKIAGEIVLIVTNKGNAPCVFKLTANKYYKNDEQSYAVSANSLVKIRLPLRKNAYWYDFSVTVEGMEGFSRRFAGHLETGRSSFTDPAMHGTTSRHHLSKSIVTLVNATEPI